MKAIEMPARHVNNSYHSLIVCDLTRKIWLEISRTVNLSVALRDEHSMEIEYGKPF